MEDTEAAEVSERKSKSTSNSIITKDNVKFNMKAIEGSDLFNKS